jgi:hypothetical protein
LPRCINRIDLDAEGRPTRVSFGDKVAAGAALLRSLPGAPAESTITVNATAVAGAAAVGDSHRPSDHVRAEVRSLLGRRRGRTRPAAEPPAEIMDSHRASALNSVLMKAEVVLRLSPAVDMALAARAERILRFAQVRRLEPRLYRVAWFVRQRLAARAG